MGNLKPVPRLKLQAKYIGLFHRKTGVMFHSLVCSALGWRPTKDYLSNFYSPIELREASLLGYQAQVIKEYLLYELYMPLTLTRQLESVGGWVCSLFLERQQRKYFVYPWFCTSRMQ